MSLERNKGKRILSKKESEWHVLQTTRGLAKAEWACEDTVGTRLA